MGRKKLPSRRNRSLSDASMPEAAKVNSMFARIAPRYDLANRMLSFGIDQFWRDRLVEEVDHCKPGLVIDLATGSGDVAFALKEGLPHVTSILGLDFCGPMIDEANRKRIDRKAKGIEFGIGDILDLPLEDATADAVTISFGYRNLEDRHRGLLEMKRILARDTGRLFILEFSQPHPVYRPFYYFYLKRILPAIASLLTGDYAAYRYLSDSIEAFPDRDGVSAEMERAGFRDVTAIPMALGSVALHIGRA